MSVKIGDFISERITEVALRRVQQPQPILLIPRLIQTKIARQSLDGLRADGRLSAQRIQIIARRQLHHAEGNQRDDEHDGNREQQAGGDIAEHEGVRG